MVFDVEMDVELSDERRSLSVSETRKNNRTLMDMMNEAKARLQNMEISCKEMLRGENSGPDITITTSNDGRLSGSSGSTSPTLANHSQLEMMQVQIEQLKASLLEAVTRREEEDKVFQQAMQYATAKSTANAVLHALFDQASAGKYLVLASWFETGVIPTRDGLKHWKMDLRNIRNEAGATLLHVAVDVSMARQNSKVKLVEFFVDRIGFDPNVRDVFGRTPLHVASMAGYLEVVQSLLQRGCDPSIQDRSGLTALSLVRTLSRPPEDVVQVLVNAESILARSFVSASYRIRPHKAIASALFLKGLNRFVFPRHFTTYSRQSNTLLSILLDAKFEEYVNFDSYLREYVPLLFDASSDTWQVTRLDTIFLDSIYWDLTFTNELKVETDGYNLSLVSTPATTSALAGPTWIGVLLKMIQCFKMEISSPKKSVEAVPKPYTPTIGQDIVMETNMSEVSGQILPDSPARVPSPSTPSPQSHACIERNSSKSRQAWYYAVLFKASTHPFAGTLAVKNAMNIAISSEDVSKYFPLEDRLLIGSAEYCVVKYDPETRQLILDREYEGVDADVVKAYLAGSCSSILPPYIAVKRIWEREPGNKFEDQMSNEQELFQDYQFLDPESDYEVAVKLGPIPTAKDARAIVDEWKRKSRELFDAKTCMSGLPTCKYYCPQRSGHSLCLETLSAIGRNLAKQRFGRPTFSKSMKARASLQKLQNQFKGRDPWPGSPPNRTESVQSPQQQQHTINKSYDTGINNVGSSNAEEISAGLQPLPNDKVSRSLDFS